MAVSRCNVAVSRCNVAVGRVRPYAAPYVGWLEYDALLDRCQCASLAALVPPQLPSFAVRAVIVSLLYARATKHPSCNRAFVQACTRALYIARKPLLDRLMIALTLHVDPTHEQALQLVQPYFSQEGGGDTTNHWLAQAEPLLDLALAFRFLEQVQLPNDADKITGAVESVVHMWLTRATVENSVGKAANVYAKRRALLTCDKQRVQCDVAALQYKCAPSPQTLEQLKQVINRMLE